MPHARPFKSLIEFDQEQLDCFQIMFNSGVVVAAAAALDYCDKHRLCPPPWLVAAATDLLCDLLKREKANRRGRSCGHVARHRQDRIDFDRWDQVKVVREKQKELKEEVEYLRSRDDLPLSTLENPTKMLEWVGSTLDRAFECAAMLLEGTDAYGSPEAIKRSYFQVERNNKDPSQRLRYHLLDRIFLSRIGITHEIGLRPGRKVVPLYELTL